MSTRPCAGDWFLGLESRQLLNADLLEGSRPVVEFETTAGIIWIELRPDVAPLTVANFLNYVNDGDYDGSVFHRAISNFVLQGGGYEWNSVQNRFDEVPSDPAVLNEFNLSNTERTIAMAKLGEDPNSATNQFFFNLGNNSGNLDNQNGGFTVFGSVIRGWEVVQSIMSGQIINFGGNIFTNTPVTSNYNQNGSPQANWFVTVNDAELIYDPARSLNVSVDNISGLAGSGASTIVTGVNQLNQPVVFRQNGLLGQWTVTDLVLESDGPKALSEAVVWFDPNDGLAYAAVATNQGVQLYRDNGDGTWTRRNLTSETGGSVVVSNLTSFQSGDNRVHLAGLDTDGDVVLFAQSTNVGPNGRLWGFRDLSDNLRDQSKTVPTFFGELTSWVTPWGAFNIAGLDAQGDLQAVWKPSGTTDWNSSNLTDITGAPALSGGLTVFQTSWSAINIVGVDANGNVQATWWLPGFGGQWRISNLTTASGGPDLVASTLSSFVAPWGALNIVGLDNSGNVYAIWWVPNGQWRATDMTSVVRNNDPNAQAFTSAVTGIVTPTGAISLVGRGSDGDVVRYWLRAGQPWGYENLTELATFG